MCGIAGVVLRSPKGSALSIVKEMIDAIQYRGPDSTAFLEHGRFGLGMCRLSINDVSGGTQPLYNQSKSVAVFYNGEIYNYWILRYGLEAKGIKFRSHCDGEVICHLYDLYGTDAFAKLDGMFAIALLDKEKDRFILARDIPGEKPLYYGRTPSGDFVFASELAALRAVPGLDLSLNRQALWDMPTFLWVPEPATVYNEILALPRSHFLVLENNVVSLHPYPNLFDASQNDLATDEELVAEIRRVVTDAIKSRLLSDVPVGSFLSGGLDSSIVATVATRELGPINTFSVGFEKVSDPYHGMADESEQAAETARFIGSRHHAIHVRADDFLHELDRLNAHAGQPYAVSSGLGVLVVAKTAREMGIKVLLTGDCADECFGGYSWYPQIAAAEAMTPIPMPSILSMHSIGVDLERRIAGIKALPLAEQAWAWHYYAHEADKARLFSDDAAHDLQSSFRHFPVSKNEKWDPIDFITHDRNFYFPNEMLSKADRMTMAYSVEGRVPFAAPSVQSLANRLSYRQMIAPDGTLKWSLRQAFADILPMDVINRPKHGFNVPIDHWLKGEWAFLIEEAFAPGSQLHKHGLVAKDALANATDLILDPARLNGYTVFSFIMMNRWLERHAH